MQIRRASFPSDSPQPPCPFDHEDQPCLQKHGHYQRYSRPESRHKTCIPRYLCKLTGKTISVLADTFLPYRSINVPTVQEHFDHLASMAQEIPPAHSPPLQRCLTRTWIRFCETDRAASLADFFGQRLPRTHSPRALWKAIRHTAGNLSQILLELATAGKSLLGDYQCLKPG